MSPQPVHLTDPKEPAAGAFSRSTMMTIRRVLHAYRDGWLLEDRLATAARLVADDARLHGLTAARMLVALKREWTALDAVRRLMPLDAQALLDALVSRAIRAYYASPAARQPSAGAHGADTRTAA